MPIATNFVNCLCTFVLKVFVVCCVNSMASVGSVKCQIKNVLPFSFKSSHNHDDTSPLIW